MPENVKRLLCKKELEQLVIQSNTVVSIIFPFFLGSVKKFV